MSVTMKYSGSNLLDAVTAVRYTFGLQLKEAIDLVKGPGFVCSEHQRYVILGHYAVDRRHDFNYADWLVKSDLPDMTKHQVKKED